MRLRQLQEIESLKAEMAPKADAVQEDLPEEETVEEEEPEHRSPNYID